MKANLKAFSTEHVPQAIVVTSDNPGGATFLGKAQDQYFKSHNLAHLRQ